jgi:hypothetical protein
MGVQVLRRHFQPPVAGKQAAIARGPIRPAIDQNDIAEVFSIHPRRETGLK